MSSPRLVIKNFAQIEKVDLTFGDLTVLVGAQGTGKSLALQWLKVAMDGGQIAKELTEAGQSLRVDNAIDLVFGVGMGSAWRGDSEILFDRKKITRQNIAKIGGGKEHVFFIPAHRALLISDGWAAPFQKLSPETPAAARLFSDALYRIFTHPDNAKVFPLGRTFKKEYRELLDQAVFRGGEVRLEEDWQGAKRLKLRHGDAALPFMTWTAGQREFAPLLLGLCYLYPQQPNPRTLIGDDIEWVVIEEPEMGLHPQALTAFLLLTLDILSRGYRVVISTHSPHVLTAMWMLRRLKETQARPQLLCNAFGVPATRSLREVAKSAFAKETRVHLLELKDDRVRSKEISSLDPGSSDEDIASWGGLASFSERFCDAVARAVNEDERRRDYYQAMP